MDTKFSSSYWSDREVESTTPEIRLAGAWMRTNDRLTLFGYAEVTPKKFAFETGLPPETMARAIQALPGWFKALPKGYFIPGYIGEQIGRGEQLICNNVCKGLVRALVALHDEEITALVLQSYPELEAAMKVAVIPKGFATPYQGVREEKSREEKSRAEQSGGDRGAGKEEGAGKKPRRSRPGSLLPSAQLEPLAARMLSLNRIFHRKEEARWTEAEFQAFKEAGLAEMPLEDFTDQVQLVVDLYRAKIPREMERRFWRRTELLRVLTNWPGELDRARAWALEQRRNDGGLQRLGGAA